MAPSQIKTALQVHNVVVAVLALGVFAMAVRPVTDPDLWWHLRTGQLIVDNHHVFHADPYSYTRFGQPWTNHEWLFDIVAFLFYRRTGAVGLMIAFAALISAALLITFLKCEGRPYAAVTVTAFGALACVPSWGVRPQMISFLFAAVFLWLLDPGSRPKISLWWTVPLMVLWVNLHAGYAVGIGLIALSLLGHVVDAWLGLEDWEQAGPQLRSHLLALLGCIAVVPLNPNGLRLYWYPWQTLGSSAMHQYIQEWAPPDFHRADNTPLLVLVLTVLIALALSSKRVRTGEFLLLAVTLFAALRSVRHVPIFVLALVPILSRLASDIRWKFRTAQKSTAPAAPHFAKTVLNALVLAGFSAFAFIHAHSVIRDQPQNEIENFPVAAVSFLEKAKLPGPLLNHYSWGGYLIWTLYPTYQVFIDGRADVYGDRMMDEMASVYYAKEQWAQVLHAWNIQTVLFPVDAPVVVLLRSAPGWHEIYHDKNAVVLTKASDPLM